MNIRFDLELKQKDFLKKSTNEEIIILRTISDYIYYRIAFMEDEINAEEKESDLTKGIYFCLSKQPHSIKVIGYSKRLTEKIYGSFNENDATLMWKSVEKELLKYLNL